MNQFSKLPKGIKEAIRQNQGLEPEDESLDETLSQNSEGALWEMYCDWHGLLGWSETLAAALDAIRESKKSEPKRKHTTKRKEPTKRNLFSSSFEGREIVVASKPVELH